MKKSRKADVILIAAIVLVGVIIGVILLLSKHDGKYVQVRVAGQVEKVFPLSQDVEYEIAGRDGGSNLLIIRDGKAWVEEADCPDKLCKNMGKISRSGQSVVCLPHEVVVEIVDETGPDDGVDIIVE